VTHLSRFPGLSKLPDAAWEQLLPNMRHLLWFTPVTLQSASLPHQTLVNRACLPTPELSDFLNAEGCNSALIKSESSAVIGQAEEDYNCNYEALLLHALDDSANDPDFAAIMPTYLLTDGALQNVSRLVDSSSWLLKTLKRSIASSPTWNAGNEPMQLDASHATATLFLICFYTGELCWPEESDARSRHECALELLQLADQYNVPVLLCAAEVALSQAIDENSCCVLLDVADSCHADQLKALCLHHMKQAYGAALRSTGHSQPHSGYWRNRNLNDVCPVSFLF